MQQPNTRCCMSLILGKHHRAFAVLTVFAARIAWNYSLIFPSSTIPFLLKYRQSKKAENTTSSVATNPIRTEKLPMPDYRIYTIPSESTSTGTQKEFAKRLNLILKQRAYHLC